MRGHIHDPVAVARILFVILLALNLGALAWALTRPASQASRLPDLEPGIVPLVLLRERDSLAMQAAAQRVEPTPTTPPPPQHCRSLGPFGDLDGAEAAIKILQPQTETTQVRRTTARIVRGYWVYIGAHANRTDALATARQLAAAGVRDYYVVTAGAQENSVALGLFRDRQNAAKRQQEVIALGFQAQMNERVDEREQLWVDYQYRGEVAPDWKSELSGADRYAESELACKS